MDNLTICTIQMDITWEKPAKNYLKIENLLAKISQPIDLILLPEMFTTGFSMDAARVAELHHDTGMASLRWMRQQAKKHGAVLAGSIATQVDGDFFNRLYWVKPSGEYSIYDKHHLFEFAGENEQYTAGESILIEELKGWKILPLICFDLRFPTWSRNYLNRGIANYDLLIYVANWPEKRRKHWQKLLEARAIENQSYVVGVNRVGKDHNGHSYAGDTVVLDYLGDNMSTHLEGEEGFLITVLSKSRLNRYRQKFPVLKPLE